MKTPQELKLPKRFKSWRPGQGEIIEKIAHAPEKVFLLDAPMGTGKTVVGIAVHQSRTLNKVGRECLARLSGKSEREYEHRCIYITRTKQLQNQLLEEFPGARTMVGRNNYPCLLHKKEFPEYTAEDCTGECVHKSECPYYVDKHLALQAPLAVLNTSYFLTEANGPGMFSGANLLIIDEIDVMENELLNHIQLRVTTRQLNGLRLELPADPHSLQGWLVWSDSISFKINEYLDRFGSQLILIDETNWTDVEITLHKQANRLKNFRNKLATFVSEVNDTWIFSEERDKEETAWVFKPVTVSTYAAKYLWRHAENFLGMSGTILDPETMASDLGIEDWAYDRTNCPFPLVNRPIYYIPKVNLTHKNMNIELPKLAQAVKEIIDRYPNDKILVHTTSFAIQQYLKNNLNSRRIISHTTQDRNEMLELFKAYTEPVVMLSPSFDRGVSLDNDFCRCVIICKCPYLSLADPQVKARLRMPGGERWYLLKTAQTIMQMSGRGVRNDIDHCDTVILDKQFGSLFSRMQRYFPQWWKEAIQEEP